MQYNVEQFLNNSGLCLQCGMMLDGFPGTVCGQIQAAREDLEKIKEIITSQPEAMIDGHFTTAGLSRAEKVNQISEFIFTFFAYRKTEGK